MKLNDLDVKTSYEIEYELYMEKYKQLHSVVLNFSINSMELKKMCVTTLVAVVTILFAFFKDKPVTYIMIRNTCWGLFAITVLFYLVDVYTYYYQKKLRDIMSDLESQIKDLYVDINSQCDAASDNPDCCIKCKNRKKFIIRLKISLLNWSNLIYYLIAILLIVFPYIFKLYNHV